MPMFKQVELLMLIAFKVMKGERGIDWQYYVTWPAYWRKWAELNRN